MCPSNVFAQWTLNCGCPEHPAETWEGLWFGLQSVISYLQPWRDNHSQFSCWTRYTLIHITSIDPSNKPLNPSASQIAVILSFCVGKDIMTALQNMWLSHVVNVRWHLSILEPKTMESKLFCNILPKVFLHSWPHVYKIKHWGMQTLQRFLKECLSSWEQPNVSMIPW